MKSCFIPETRVQVYFLEHNLLYKALPDLIYKARNGRVFSDLDERFAFFSFSAIDTLTSLFWAPDIFICNDWQTSFVPLLLNQKFKHEDFYANMKTIYILHSINDYSYVSKKTYDMLGLNTKSSDKLINNHIPAIENSDLTIIMNYESTDLLESLKKDKNLYKTIKENECEVIDMPKKTNREAWKDAVSTIKSLCEKLR